MQSPKKTIPVREGLRAKAALAVEPQPQPAVDQHAIGEGRKPLASRRKNLPELRAKVIEMYGVPPAGLAPAAAIESAFKFSPLESDAEFSSFHVEPLLHQAEELLGRCAELRSRHHELQMAKWNLQLELDRFLRLDQVQEQERAAGIHTLPYERAARDAGAEGSLESNHKRVEAQLGGLTDDLISSGFNKRMAARELSAWLAAYPLKDSELRGDDASYSFDGVQKSKPDHLFEAARLETDQAAWEQFADLMARRFAAMGSSEAGRLRKESLELEAKWALANIAFPQEKAQAERDALWEKVYQAQQPGGLFNYSERIAPVERDFSSGFREALARLMAAQRGMKELYDYAPPLPKEGAAGYFDEIMLWVRKAQDRLGYVSRLDQNYVLAVSVKELAKSDWEAGRAASQWTFEVPEELFKGQAHVRLRGLGLAVAGEPEPADSQKSKGGQKGQEQPVQPQGFWSATLSLPASAMVRYASGTTSEVDQKSLPRCHFGRIANRDSPRDPEVGGITALHNASPIGKQWKLALSPKSTDGWPTANLQDVMLYLHVAVRGQKAEG